MSMIQAFSLLKDRVKYGLIEEHLQQTNNPNMVCMIRFAKIGFYRGDVQITNAFDSSMICFDPDLPECLALKNNMPNDEFALALTDTKNDKCPIKDQIDDWNDVGIKSISEIIMATQEEDCKIICSIESIDTDWSWFIFGHVSRNRFKLHLIVKDDTSTCKLMLLDSVAKVVVGCDAKDIWDVWSGDNILQIESNSEPITHVSTSSSIMSGGEVSLTEKSEANSSEGSSTPFSKRKEKDQVDQISTSKKLCTKVVKMEKIKDDELNV
ncbi:unnamed protein product [Brassica oleracea]